MNRNENEAESFAGNFVASGEEGLFFEVPSSVSVCRLRTAEGASNDFASAQCLQTHPPAFSPDQKEPAPAPSGVCFLQQN